MRFFLEGFYYGRLERVQGKAVHPGPGRPAGQKRRLGGLRHRRGLPQPAGRRPGPPPGPAPGCKNPGQPDFRPHPDRRVRPGPGALRLQQLALLQLRAPPVRPGTVQLHPHDLPEHDPLLPAFSGCGCGHDVRRPHGPPRLFQSVSVLRGGQGHSGQGQGGGSGGQ